MKIMVVGGGGREHAIIKKIKENKSVEKIYALPGNGGISSDAESVNIGAKDIEKIVEFAVENKIDFAVVAPDDPLVLGAVDALEEKGIVGPFEGSKPRKVLISKQQWMEMNALANASPVREKPYGEEDDFSEE